MVYSCFPRVPSSLVTRREGSFYGRVKAVNILVTQERPRLETSTRHGSSVKRGGPVVLAPVALRLFIEVNLSLRRVYTVEEMKMSVDGTHNLQEQKSGMYMFSLCRAWYSLASSD